MVGEETVQIEGGEKGGEKPNRADGIQEAKKLDLFYFLFIFSFVQL